MMMTITQAVKMKKVKKSFLIKGWTGMSWTNKLKRKIERTLSEGKAKIHNL
mgnify:CR=1 FL=1